MFRFLYGRWLRFAQVDKKASDKNVQIPLWPMATQITNLFPDQENRVQIPLWPMATPKATANWGTVTHVQIPLWPMATNRAGADGEHEGVFRFLYGRWLL